MENQNLSIRITGLKYGIITGVICIVYFLIMFYSGLVHHTVLQLLNFAILAIGMFLAFNEVTHKIHKHNINYLPGMALGFIIVLSSAVLFSFFIFIFSMFINPDFLTIIKPDLASFQGDLNPYIITIYVFVESLLFGAVLDFIVMQFFKRNENQSTAETDPGS